VSLKVPVAPVLLAALMLPVAQSVTLVQSVTAVLAVTPPAPPVPHPAYRSGPFSAPPASRSHHRPEDPRGPLRGGRFRPRPDRVRAVGSQPAPAGRSGAHAATAARWVALPVVVLVDPRAQVARPVVPAGRASVVIAQVDPGVADLAVREVPVDRPAAA
jgi:hypothetical protein